MTMTPLRRLGKTDLQIRQISLGSVGLTTDSLHREQGIAVVERALELGVNYIDTAPFYGDSQSVVGQALQGHNEPYILGTKCGRWTFVDGPYRDLDAIKSQFEQTLTELRRDRVDILYIHEADWIAWWKDMKIPRHTKWISQDESYDFAGAPVTQFLNWARQQNLTTYLGISGNNADLLAKVLREHPISFDVVLCAFQYSLIWRNAPRQLLPLTRELDVGVVLGAPLQQGRLAVPHTQWLDDRPEWMDEDLQTRFARLYNIHQRSESTLAQLGLRFLLADDRVATIPCGAASIAELEENMEAAAAGPLPKYLRDQIEPLGKVVAARQG